MGAAMIYECDGPGCGAVTRDAMPPSWRTQEGHFAPGSPVPDLPPGHEMSTLPTPGYSVTCSPRCRAALAVTEAIATGEPAGEVAELWRSIAAAIPPPAEPATVPEDDR